MADDELDVLLNAAEYWVMKWDGLKDEPNHALTQCAAAVRDEMISLSLLTVDHCPWEVIRQLIELAKRQAQVTHELRELVQSGWFDYDQIPYELATPEIERLYRFQPQKDLPPTYSLDEQAIDDILSELPPCS